MIRLLRALIDTAALRHNLGTIRAYAPGSKVMAVIKANAYGHGLVSTALALADADSFAVARLEEGIALRSAGVRAPIVLLEGVVQRRATHRSRASRLRAGGARSAAAEVAGGASRRRALRRLDQDGHGYEPPGFPARGLRGALSRLRALAVPALELRVMTHLARADERHEPMTREQIDRFESALAAAGLTGAQRLATSIGNSAGTLGWPRAHGDWVRPGLALYGVSPFAGETAAKHGLKPAMTLETTVLTVREVKRGETVGYAGGWRAERDSSIAILAAGYGDGLPRHLSNGTPVLIGGARYPLVGRVSMDMIAVDVTGAPKVATGNKAVIWGEGLPVEEIASARGHDSLRAAVRCEPARSARAQ